MTELFRDRRPNAEPTPEDYDRPLTRTTLTEANKRFREAGVQAVVGNDSGTADSIVRKAIKERFNARRKGFDEFSSVGAYLDYLAEQVK